MMVFQSERVPPLSHILPQLYLGAETDVTQECLSARGISYVLSVSRCCPQPSFLPASRYLRIPIDDSLRDDLLPWIPQALSFIDGAMSLGCSVLVHCAAGISRSPALAVAYVMYSLGMDLDHAYRFVKERRPTISPNFNFLGQLQVFQHTLPPQNADARRSHVASPDTQARPDADDDVRTAREKIQPEFTSSLSDQLRTLSLGADEGRRADERTPQKPAHLRVPSLSEKRKNLTLSLTPIRPAAVPRNDQQGETTLPSHGEPRGSPSIHEGETKDPEKERKRVVSGGTWSRCSRTQKRRSEEEKSGSPATHRPREEQAKATSAPQRRERGRRTARSACCSAPRPQRETVRDVSGCAVEALELMDGDQSPVSPIHLTINRLLGWGERMLLGVLLGPHIKVGQVSLPYSC